MPSTQTLCCRDRPANGKQAIREWAHIIDSSEHTLYAENFGDHVRLGHGQQVHVEEEREAIFGDYNYVSTHKTDIE